MQEGVEASALADAGRATADLPAGRRDHAVSDRIYDYIRAGRSSRQDQRRGGGNLTTERPR